MRVLRWRKQTGNTIIEVMIALSIIGIILAGAYATSTRSLRITRQSEERTQSVQIAKNQLEVIKAMASSATSEAGSEKIWDETRPFCINSELATPSPIYQFGSANPLPLLESADLRTTDEGGFYPRECVQKGLFYVHSIFDGSDRFTVTVRWNRLGGGSDEVRYVYGLREIN